MTTLADLKRMTLAARYGLPHTHRQAEQINAWIDWSRRERMAAYPSFSSSVWAHQLPDEDWIVLGAPTGHGKSPYRDH